MPIKGLYIFFLSKNSLFENVNFPTQYPSTHTLIDDSIASYLNLHSDDTDLVELTEEAGRSVRFDQLRDCESDAHRKSSSYNQ